MFFTRAHTFYFSQLVLQDVHIQIYFLHTCKLVLLQSCCCNVKITLMRQGQRKGKFLNMVALTIFGDDVCVSYNPSYCKYGGGHNDKSSDIKQFWKGVANINFANSKVLFFCTKFLKPNFRCDSGLTKV